MPSPDRLIAHADTLAGVVRTLNRVIADPRHRPADLHGMRQVRRQYAAIISIAYIRTLISIGPNPLFWRSLGFEELVFAKYEAERKQADEPTEYRRELAVLIAIREIIARSIVLLHHRSLVRPLGTG